MPAGGVSAASDDGEIAAIATHSARVPACFTLHRAGMGYRADRALWRKAKGPELSGTCRARNKAERKPDVELIVLVEGITGIRIRRREAVDRSRTRPGPARDPAALRVDLRPGCASRIETGVTGSGIGRRVGSAGANRLDHLNARDLGRTLAQPIGVSELRQVVAVKPVCCKRRTANCERAEKDKTTMSEPCWPPDAVSRW